MQDLWLLLPGRMADSRRELELLPEGYEQFRLADRRSVRLIEPLRVMRMIYYLAWSALQRRDPGFRAGVPALGRSGVLGPGSRGPAHATVRHRSRTRLTRPRAGRV